MLQTITAAKARNNFADLLGKVYYGKKKFLIERLGKPFAVLINLEEYKMIETIRKSLFKEILRKRASNKNVSRGQVVSDINEVLNIKKKLKS